MIDKNEDVTLTELCDTIGKSFNQNVLDLVRDQIDDLLIKKGTTEGLIQKTLQITAMNPEIQYLKLKRQLTKQFGAPKFNKCKARVKKILDRRLTLMNGVISDSSSSVPIIPASDSSLMTNKKTMEPGMRKSLLRRRTSLLPMSHHSRDFSSTKAEEPPRGNIKTFKSMEGTGKTKKKKTLKRAASAQVQLASLRSRGRRNVDGKNLVTLDRSPSPYAVPRRAAPIHLRSYSIDKKDGSSDKGIGNAVELVFLVCVTLDSLTHTTTTTTTTTTTQHKNDRYDSKKFL